ncbi:MAG: 1-deoxy-D-xylulose-5-phosphate reductoisomerase [Muribaculaceae bacterium]|nr:1-deoxy-D-xylulose-5-phosphate reductoisomerase [Muribaculaceae bacterium]
MTKNLAILGSTGSIGTQTLELIRRFPHRYRASALVAGHRVDDLIAQALEFRPDVAVIADESLYGRLREALAPHGIEAASGAAAVEEAAAADGVDMTVTATVGYSGLAPTLAAIRAGKDIALANKETLVVAGELVTGMLAHSRSRIFPVDSEHSAIFQCLRGEDPESVRRLIITASGGPFRTWDAERIARATAADALRHPNWSMGAKITIDSATMLNKAFEIIEARWLFGLPPERIDAIVHPQSIIHSMVEFRDGAIKAQMGVPDMTLPIAYALGETVRTDNVSDFCSLTAHDTLTFEEPDTKRFPGITLARRALEAGGNLACVINAANEVAVSAFLHGQISFPDIYATIVDTAERATRIESPSYDDYVASNAEARRIAQEIISLKNR